MREQGNFEGGGKDERQEGGDHGAGHGREDEQVPPSRPVLEARGPGARQDRPHRDREVLVVRLPLLERRGRLRDRFEPAHRPRGVPARPHGVGREAQRGRLRARQRARELRLRREVRRGIRQDEAGERQERGHASPLPLREVVRDLRRQAHILGVLRDERSARHLEELLRALRRRGLGLEREADVGGQRGRPEVHLEEPRVRPDP
mmetsp:Transcript_84039/g.234070  ORF Transcript_84039/g.234070 Transcript_84039/m.234070 type:complete len:205 (+) Transcript_84039:271-885(+)